MMKGFRICFIMSVYFLTVAAAPNDKCERCMPIDDCALFRDMTEREKKDMITSFPCGHNENEAGSNTPFGFSAIAKGDYICCPEANVWGIEDPQKPQISANYQKPDDSQPQRNDHVNDYNNDQNNQRYDSNNGDNNRFGHNNNQDNQNQDQNFDSDTNISDNNENKDIGAGSYEQHRTPHHRRPQFNMDGIFGMFTQRPPRKQNYRTPAPNFNNPNYNLPNGNIPNFNGPNGNVPNFNYPNNNFPNGNSNIQNQRPSNGNSFGTNSGGQCTAISSFPPAPETGCCGRDLSVGDRITGPTNGYVNYPAQNPNNQWPRANYPTANNPWSSNNGRRFKRTNDLDKINITIDNRITGGKETELEQFPWTVLLKTTFDYGNKKAAFNCGGSIISARYVLTAAHCVYEEGARVSDIEVMLAEYDKRTFPRDCVNVAGEGRRCIDNVVMHAEDAVYHPEYDDKRLQNDIALIRLRGNAPYTDFIRPICLPPIDIDNPEFSDLRVAVAGWGRNGRFRSEVKQSTVVNLVPQRECARHYPQLTRRHLCAAGHSGEDTCKGDSGGPLMMLYEGKYFVSGVVSGKRADSPCGTSVPSLYTNVFHYIDWIRNTIRN